MSTVERVSRAEVALRVMAIRPCPVCGGERSTLRHRFHLHEGKVRGIFDLRRCLDCDLQFIDPRLADHDLTRLYDEDFYFSTGWSYDALAQWTIDQIQSARRRRVERHRSSGRLLDIGCGDGSFVHHMADHGWAATGIDFSPAALRYAGRRASGARFLRGALSDLAFPPASFDVITMWQVLEHIGEPLDHLSRCRALLSPRGTLVVAVPNIEGLSSLCTRERWWGLDVPRHLVHFSPRTLGDTVRRAGFTVLSIRHRSLQYDPYALLHSSLDWCFTRRHFLSDLAKRHTFPGMSRRELAYNLAVLALMAPLLAPASLLVTSVGAAIRRGGFIELHARRV